MSNFKKEVFKNKEEISRAAAEIFITKAAEKAEKRKPFSVSLSGGSTPKALFELLATPEYAERINWRWVHLFWGDERCVPSTHHDSNYRMVEQALLKKIEIPATNVHRVRTELDPKLAAAEYRAELNLFFGQKQPAFDLFFLGMGDDGHTASIFPGTRAVHMARKRVAEIYVKKLKAWRITMAAPVINRAKTVIFLVAGSSKAKALKEVWHGEYNPDVYPAQLLRAAEGDVVWYLDEVLGKLV